MPPGDRQGKRFLNPWRPWRQKRNWERDREHSRVAIYNGVGFVKAQISGASWYEVFTFEESFLPFLSKARFLQSIGRNELQQPSMRSCAFRPRLSLRTPVRYGRQGAPTHGNDRGVPGAVATPGCPACEPAVWLLARASTAAPPSSVRGPSRPAGPPPCRGGIPGAATPAVRLRSPP